MKKRNIASILSLVMVLALLAGCSSKAMANDAMMESAPGASAGGMSYDKPTEMPAPSPAPIAPSSPSLDAEYVKGDLNYGASSDTVGGNEAAQTERKLIKNANFTLETLEYDKTIQMIQELANRSGGYVQNSSVSGNGANYKEGYSSRSANFTLRIPADRLGEFTSALAECGSITRSNEYVDEVTDTYYDVTARLETLRLQEDRLLAILEKATELKDVITLESALSDVRYQIERFQGQLRRLDDQISLSTVTIYVSEVYTYTPTYNTPKTLGERLSQNFQRGVEDLVDSFEYFLVWLARNVFNLVIWAVIIVLAVTFLRRRIRKLRRKTAVAEPAPDEQSK